MSWLDSLDADLQAHVTNRGWQNDNADTAVVKAVKAHAAAQKHIGVPEDQIVRMPKDAADPAYAAVYERVAGLGAPPSPEGYALGDVKFKDGSPLAEADAKFVREVGAAFKLPVHVVQGIAQRFVARGDEASTAGAQQSQAAQAANDTALKSTWGAQYDTQAASVAKVVDGLKTLGIGVSPQGDPAAHVAQMAGLLKLADQFKEAPWLGGGNPAQTDEFGALSMEQAERQMETFKLDDAWRGKFFSNDQATLDQYTRLVQRIARLRTGG